MSTSNHNGFTNGATHALNGIPRRYYLLRDGEAGRSEVLWLERFDKFTAKVGASINWHFERGQVESSDEELWIATLLVNGHQLDVRGQGRKQQGAKAHLVEQLEVNGHMLLATLFGIIVALEYLERAYVRDAINAAEYTPACTRLLSQYKTMLKLVGDSVPSVEEFMRRYNMDHPAALHRVQVGVPATIEHSSDQQGSAETAKWVAETTQSFITFMDALNLKLRAKDQLHPRLQELMTGYARFKDSAKWEGRGKIVSWLITLNAMKASDEISEDQARQLLFDIDHAYHEFFSSLGGGKDSS
ncbi:vacuolar protein sorting-associated protein 28 [Rhizoctonia solani]|uniref:Vacuolar protein sorting-associated protein 28 n=1 Tax=Rhizoctonia solani TaxID=456999 RepID=A0A8H8NQJ4_9AGAM|nr:vacuolar protein sorting-associated protein 28 [Rhizoctonia solani]QRW18064.1 vacuolar protein sorting-associated protein 28 [Rhizoctonia solani]